MVTRVFIKNYIGNALRTAVKANLTRDMFIFIFVLIKMHSYIRVYSLASASFASHFLASLTANVG